ncbi:hypothetical protein [Nocardia sp. NPDC003963]
MSGLGSWTGVKNDLTLRLRTATEEVAQQRARTNRGAASRLREAARQHDDNDRTLVLGFTDPAPPGARGAVSPSGRFSAYSPSATEAHVATRDLTIDWEMSSALPGSANGVYVARDATGILYVYKPARHEIFDGRDWIPPVPGQLALREVGGYRVSELMGSRLVPPTALVDGPMGPGSAKLYIPMKASKNWKLYRPEQQPEGAMVHFLVGNGDGHSGNCRPKLQGDNHAQHPADDLVLYDLAYTFPESPDFRRGPEGFSFRSDFHRNFAGKEFPHELLQRVGAITPDRMGSALEDLRFSDSAIDGALWRLSYVHRTGTIFFA